MASIMKRGNTYSVRYNYKDHAGKPCKGWETFKTKAEAQERKITVEKELLDGTFLVPDTMTVEEMLYKWIPIQSSKHKWSPKTYTQSVAMVQNLIVPYIGKRKVQDLRTYDIEQFYATLSQTPCGQYVHGEKQELTENQKKRLLSSTSIHEVHTLLKTAFSYAVDWDLIHKSPTPREAPKINTEERTIWDERTMLAALQTIENPALHLAVHMSMILSLREGEILGLQPSDLDFDAADGRGTISVSKTMQRANKDALEKLDPNQVYHTFPDRREGSKSSLILKKPKTKKSNRVLYMTKPLKEELLGTFPPALLGRIVSIPYVPLSAEVLGGISRLKLGSVARRMRDSHGTQLVWDDAVIDHIVAQCRDPDSGGRMIDNIITNSILPDLSRQVLSRMVSGAPMSDVTIKVDDGGFAYDFA